MKPLLFIAGLANQKNALLHSAILKFCAVSVEFGNIGLYAGWMGIQLMQAHSTILGGIYIGT
jgi:hypothetical protein